MNDKTKIHLSKIERQLIQNKEWILTKQSIINKVYLLFGEVLFVYKKILEKERASIFNFYKNTNGKISKGENYLELPYVMLDYPAFFTKENIFAIRTMFWWGNFFSVSLHLSMKKFQLQNNYSELLLFLKEKKFYICINEDEWQHTFHSSNYIAAVDLNEDVFNKILQRNFFKISKKTELNKWNSTPEFLEKTFLEIVEFIKISFPAGEKDLSPGFPKGGSDL